MSQLWANVALSLVMLAVAAYGCPGCASDNDAAQPPPEPTPANVCANLARICPETLDSCETSMRFVWEVAPMFGVDVYCLQKTDSVTEARSCGYPCGGDVT